MLEGLSEPKEETGTISALVQFKLPQPVTREKAKETLLSTAAKYRETPGLLRKYYLLFEDGGTAGGVYLWIWKYAEGFNTKEWEDFIREGTEHRPPGPTSKVSRSR